MLAGMRYPERRICIPAIPKSPNSYSLVIQTISASSRTLRALSSNSRLTMYSKAAPSQVHPPCPTPTTKRWRWPRRIRSTARSSARAASWACSGVQTDMLLASGPRPSVMSKRSRGPVALMRKS